MLWSILHTFWELLREALPLFLLGAVLGAAAEVWLEGCWVECWVGGGHRSLFTAALAGALLPGYAMSTMPLAHSLRACGAATGTLTAFIMVAPLLSPQTVILTATLLSVPMAIGRVALSLAVSLLLGALLNATHKPPRLAAAVSRERWPPPTHRSTQRPSSQTSAAAPSKAPSTKRGSASLSDFQNSTTSCPLDR